MAHMAHMIKSTLRSYKGNFAISAIAPPIMDCCESTARKWLQEVSARYIMENVSVYYLREDVIKARDFRNAYYKAQAEAAAKKKAENEAKKKASKTKGIK